MNIWVQLKNTEPEKVEENVAKADIVYLVGEYRMAYGSDFSVWAGLKRDAPYKWK